MLDNFYRSMNNISQDYQIHPSLCLELPLSRFGPFLEYLSFEDEVMIRKRRESINHLNRYSRTTEIRYYSYSVLVLVLYTV